MEELFSLIRKRNYSFGDYMEYDRMQEAIHLNDYYIISQGDQFTVIDETEICAPYTGCRSEIINYLNGIQSAIAIKSTLNTAFYTSFGDMIDYLYDLNQKERLN
jgi:hypothetical protein